VWTSWAFRQLKLWKFINPRLWRPPSWKSKNHHISALVWPLATTFGMVTQSTLFSVPTVKISKFKNPTWRRPLCSKIEKSPYLRNYLTDRHEIRHGDAVCRFWAFWRLKFRNLKIEGRANAKCHWVLVQYSLYAWFVFVVPYGRLSWLYGLSVGMLAHVKDFPVCIVSESFDR